MEGKVLIVEPLRLVREAIGGMLDRHGYQVLAAESATIATSLPHRFDCGVFSDTIPDASAISLAGWFLVERRIGSAVFFGITDDVDFRLRASNLGTFVGRPEGLHRLLRAIKDSLSGYSQSWLAAGAESIHIDSRSSPAARRGRIP